MSGLTGFMPRARKSASLLSKKPSGRAPFAWLILEPAISSDFDVRSPAGWIFIAFPELPLGSLSISLNVTCENVIF